VEVSNRQVSTQHRLRTSPRSVIWLTAPEAMIVRCGSTWPHLRIAAVSAPGRPLPRRPTDSPDPGGQRYPGMEGLLSPAIACDFHWPQLLPISSAIESAHYDPVYGDTAGSIRNPDAHRRRGHRRSLESA